MNTYLTIMVTVLVLTQIVRIVQNTIQLHRQYKLFQAQLGQLDDITQEDLDMQRRAYRLIVDYLERHESNTVWRTIFFCIKRKHPDWSNKRITACTRYAYRRSCSRLRQTCHTYVRLRSSVLTAEQEW